MVIDTETSSFIRDRSALDKAHELKEKANQAYKEHEYSSAVRLYHQCLLSAKAVVQLSLTNLQEMARGERALNPQENAEPDAMNQPPASSSDSAIEDDVALKEKQAGVSQTNSGRLRIDSTSRGEEMKQEATALIIKCYNNLAACIVNGPPRQKDDYLRAVSYCDKVLEVEADNEKAIFRKACAYQKAEKYDKAIDLFQKCPNNAQASVFAEECRLKAIEERKRRDAAIRANFAKARAAEQRNGGHADGPMMNGNAVNGNVRQ